MPTVRVLQITDCHLGERVGEVLAGMDTDASLDYVLASIDARERSNGVSPADFLLATGDLANHGSAAAYRRLDRKLAQLPMSSAWLPGNHDDVGVLLQSVQSAVLPGVILAGNWALVLMDSTVAGQVGGELGDEELDRLEDVLAQLPTDCYVMVAVHHQVLPVGSHWLDEQQIADSERLLALLAGEKRLRIVVSGHVHQDFNARHPELPGVEFLTSPSTCIQFAPRTGDFKIDDKLPGYRWFELHEDGSFETGVNRVENADLTMDLASSGY